MTIAEHIENLRKYSDESIYNGEPVQIPEAMAPGDMLPQGDIGLLMFEEVPSGWKEIGWPNDGDLQLAPGNTRGSRHMIPRRFRDHVRIFRVDDRDRLSDLGLLADKPFDLTHPEHADHIGYPAGIYRVRHQQNQQRERVLD